MRIEEIRSRLRAGQIVLDADFDAWLPPAVRDASTRYWTQVGVAARVSRWLRTCRVSSVLDVGSGAGKFCVVGASCAGISFTGVEQRAHLVDAARKLAARFGVTSSAKFVHGDVDAVDYGAFDALYFYNPFGENIQPVRDRLDETVEISRARFYHDVAKVELLLRRMPVGSRLVTYNGYGGRVPDSFELVQAKRAGVNMLRLWRKAREQDEGGYWLELEDATPFRLARTARSGTAASDKNTAQQTKSVCHDGPGPCRLPPAEPIET